jgi:hypothetical protein
MRRKASFALAAVLALGLMASAAAGAATVLKSRMTGAQIVNDDGGAPRGVAQATLRLNAARHRICFDISFSGIGGKATAGYLRRGGPGQLARSSATPASGCVRKVGSRTMRALAQHPAGHYVDLASARYPKGAVRGQLREGDVEETELEGPPSGGVG